MSKKNLSEGHVLEAADVDEIVDAATERLTKIHGGNAQVSKAAFVTQQEKNRAVFRGVFTEATRARQGLDDIAGSIRDAERSNQLAMGYLREGLDGIDRGIGDLSDAVKVGVSATVAQGEVGIGQRADLLQQGERAHGLRIEQLRQAVRVANGLDTLVDSHNLANDLSREAARQRAEMVGTLNSLANSSATQTRLMDRAVQGLRSIDDGISRGNDQRQRLIDAGEIRNRALDDILYHTMCTDGEIIDLHETVRSFFRFVVTGEIPEEMRPIEDSQSSLEVLSEDERVFEVQVAMIDAKIEEFWRYKMEFFHALGNKLK